VRSHILAVPLIAIAGCGNALLPGDDGGSSTLGSFAVNAAPTFEESNANGLLELAEFVEVTGESEIISGSINSESDVDVFDLGPVAAGDRVFVSLTPDAALKSVVALFDDTGAALLVNDHQNVYLGKKGPFIDVVIRRASESCLVAVAGTPGFSSSGSYILGASVEFPVEIPELNPDVVLLDFDGAFNVRISTRPSADVPPFDASDIDDSLSGDTDAIVRRIVQRIRDDFAPYDVTILSTSEGDVADDTTTSIYFGRFDPALLGVAEGVDEYNATSGQSAIVFTDTFEAFMVLRPSLSELSQAIANVASHEIGHLLGLVHTQDPGDLMDVTASLRALMIDQDFSVAPLYQAVFPIGSQDSAQLLLDSVGGDASLAFGKVKQRQSVRDDPYDLSAWEQPAREQLQFGSCGLLSHQGRGSDEAGS